MSATSPGFEVVRLATWSDLLARIDAHGQRSAATPFQAGSWLTAWYQTLGTQEILAPLALEIRDTTTGRPLLALPLVKLQEAGLTVAEFADLDITDYNAPLANHAALDRIAPTALWTGLRSELGDCDVLRLRKMPPRLFGGDNPLARLPGNKASDLSGNVVTISDSWDDYRRRLARKFRREMERSLRVFERDGREARFVHVTSLNDAHSILATMEKQQETRIADLGRPFLLNDAPYKAFYRRLLDTGLSDGSVVMTALKSEPDELVAALIGILDGDSYAMVRLAHAGQSWSQCSPGKLVIERTMHWLHARGVRRFDLTTGDYTYKKSFLIERQPLVDVVAPLSLRGRAVLYQAALLESVKNQLRRAPRVYEALKLRF